MTLKKFHNQPPVQVLSFPFILTNQAISLVPQEMVPVLFYLWILRNRPVSVVWNIRWPVYMLSFGRNLGRYLKQFPWKTHDLIVISSLLSFSPRVFKLDFWIEQTSYRNQFLGEDLVQFTSSVIELTKADSLSWQDKYFNFPLIIQLQPTLPLKSTMCQKQNRPCHNDQVYGQKPAMEKNHKSKLVS